MKKFVDVIVPLPIANQYTYSLPQEMEEMVQIGCRVVVPFGKKKFYTAIVTNVHYAAPEGYETKDIAEVLDSSPVLLPKQYEFWQWLAEYYLCTLGDVYKAAIPSGKGAVHVHADTGKAWIDHDTCISCGICHKSCPYHAIVYIPVPCEESCPVKAISKDEHGIEHIDENKCIYCGKCMNACPFGAIFEISQTFDVLQRIRKGEQVVAIVAPSILGQFSTTIEQVYGAFRQIGFTDIIEVAQGAMSTVEHEAHELIEKLEEGQKFMTTSCCPSYIELVNKYIPDMKKYVSGTGSPMYYAARIAKEKYPDAKIVFVGPCVAKRKEAQRDEAVDFVMTFEEVSSIFDAFEVNLEIVQPYAMEFSSVREAHGFAQAGGVMGAVKAFLKMEADKINAIQVSDLNKKNIGTLRAYAKSGKAPGQFIEVMACEGGCITGPSTHSGSNGKRQLVQELAKQEKTY